MHQNAKSEVKGRTVQEYIDETPIWRDSTDVSSTPMTNMQWLIWGLATAGKFFEGLVVFMTGVALPLMREEWALSASEKGVVAAAPLFGILIGATALGGLADHYGRKLMFIIEMIMFAVFIVGLVLAPNYAVAVACLFGIGLALGCDYPTAHLVISESIPSSVRGRMVLGAFGFQAVGALAGTGIGFVILYADPAMQAWRWMYAVTLLPAIPVIIGRFFITQSPHWLVAKGRYEEAEKTLMRLLHRHPQYPKRVDLHRPDLATEMHTRKQRSQYVDLFKGKNLRRTIFASVPWFLQDLGTYGIGIFTPTILAAIFGAKATENSLQDIVHNDMLGAEGAAVISFLLIIGIIFAVFLADKVGRIKLQILGFIGCAVGLFIAAMSQFTTGAASMVLIFAGFMLFSFMTNMGPNAMTYLIAGEVFPTKVRGKGAGFAASFAKVGAVLTAFLFPILLSAIGTVALLMGLVITSLAGAWVTWAYQVETKGLNLEKMDLEEPTPSPAPLP